MPRLQFLSAKSQRKQMLLEPCVSRVRSSSFKVASKIATFPFSDMDRLDVTAINVNRRTALRQSPSGISFRGRIVLPSGDAVEVVSLSLMPSFT
jgi:hypothetical protein